MGVAINRAGTGTPHHASSWSIIFLQMTCMLGFEVHSQTPPSSATRDLLLLQQAALSFARIVVCEIGIHPSLDLVGRQYPVAGSIEGSLTPCRFRRQILFTKLVVASVVETFVHFVFSKEDFFRKGGAPFLRVHSAHTHSGVHRVMRYMCGESGRHPLSYLQGHWLSSSVDVAFFGFGGRAMTHAEWEHRQPAAQELITMDSTPSFTFFLGPHARRDSFFGTEEQQEQEADDSEQHVFSSKAKVCDSTTGCCACVCWTLVTSGEEDSFCCCIIRRSFCTFTCDSKAAICSCCFRRSAAASCKMVNFCVVLAPTISRISFTTFDSFSRLSLSPSFFPWLLLFEV